MTVEEAIEALDILRIFDAPELSKAVKMAVAALRAQQAPAKLDRSRWEGCEHCAEGAQREICVNVGNYVCCEDCGCEGCGYFQKANYCKICGKPLTDAADAALRKREDGAV